MEIIISDSRTIKEVQQDFSKEFPFLKLEFFDAPHTKQKALPKSKMFANDKKLSAIRKLHKDGEISIAGNETVNDLEVKFWKIFGLSAQVFRKSGNLWIETSLTDSWTLEQQNREGLEMSATRNNPYKAAEDRDITDRDKWE
jgi:hypothetical protein